MAVISSGSTWKWRGHNKDARRMPPQHRRPKRTECPGTCPPVCRKHSRTTAQRPQLRCPPQLRMPPQLRRPQQTGCPPQSGRPRLVHRNSAAHNKRAARRVFAATPPSPAKWPVPALPPRQKDDENFVFPRVLAIFAAKIRHLWGPLSGSGLSDAAGNTLNYNKL